MDGNNNIPTISVIVPIYNVESYLRTCVDSVLIQAFMDFELILVDDGSTDRCPEICEEYKKNDNRVVVIHKKNGGLPSARNAGLNIAKGKYISFIDSDDWINKDYLSSLYTQLKKDCADSCMAREIGVIFEKGVIVNSEVWTNDVIKVDIDEETFVKKSHSMGLCDNRKLMKRSLFYNDDGTLIKFNEELGYGEDFYFYYDLAKKKKYKMTTSLEAIYFYRKIIGNSGVSRWQNKKLHTLISILFKDIKNPKYKDYIKESEFLNFYNHCFISRYMYDVKHFRILELVSLWKERIYYFKTKRSRFSFVEMFFPYFFLVLLKIGIIR